MRRLPQHAAALSVAQSANRWPVSDEKIGFDYKLKRFLEGCRMPAARAHAYWGGTFTDREKQRLVQPALPGALHSHSGSTERRGRRLCPRTCGSIKNIICPTTF